MARKIEQLKGLACTAKMGTELSPNFVGFQLDLQKKKVSQKKNDRARIWSPEKTLFVSFDGDGDKE